MGGQGSGRPPSIKTIIERSAPKPVLIGNGVELPNYSGVQKVALKTETALSSGGAPTDAKYIVQTANATLSAEQALGDLATGIVKNTTTTGVLSIAAEGTDYYKPTGTDVAVVDGGTGASTAGDARTNLGLAIGTDVQAYDAQLADVAGLTPTDNGVIIGNGSNFVVEEGATLKTSLGLTIGTNVQAYDATLAALASYNTNGLITQTAADTFTGRTITGTSNEIDVSNGNGVSGNPTLSLSSNAKLWSLNFVIDGGGSAITTGVKGFIEIPFAGTITGWTALGDQSGSIVVDVWKDTYANFPPTVADTIAGTEKPTISSATKGQDLALSSWTTSISAGDIIGFNVDSITTLQRVTIALRGTKP